MAARKTTKIGLALFTLNLSLCYGQTENEKPRLKAVSIEDINSDGVSEIIKVTEEYPYATLGYHKIVVITNDKHKFEEIKSRWRSG